MKSEQLTLRVQEGPYSLGQVRLFPVKVFTLCMPLLGLLLCNGVGLGAPLDSWIVLL